MGELQLLRDSLKQLDDLFLVVVVGEFNSGKHLSRANSNLNLNFVSSP